MSKKAVFVVDDHPIVQMGLISFFERNKLFDSWTIASTGKEALAILKNRQAFVKGGGAKPFEMIIFDINLPDIEISALLTNTRRIVGDEMPVLIMSLEPPQMYMKRLLEIGIQGYISKNAPDDELLFAIKSVKNKKRYFSSEALESTLSNKKGQSSEVIDELSSRESEILMLLLSGKKSKEICELVHLHKSSVATYKSRIFSKIGVQNEIDLYKWAVNQDLVKR